MITAAFRRMPRRGEQPPFHAPVFVLTRHAREPQSMAGGTTFRFVTGGTAGEVAVSESGQACDPPGTAPSTARGEPCAVLVPHDRPGRRRVRVTDGRGDLS